MAGVFLLVTSLLVLTLCLVCIVKLLGALLNGKIQSALESYSRKPERWYNVPVALLVGALLTIVVQSSSVFTSTLTPLVGMGAITLETMYPLTVGSNIGTTGTSLLAAMASPPATLPQALQVALVHLMFNLSGMFLYIVLPNVVKGLRMLCAKLSASQCKQTTADVEAQNGRLHVGESIPTEDCVPTNPGSCYPPVYLAKCMGKITARHKWFPIVYVILAFLLLPLSIFGLSMLGKTVMLVVLTLISSPVIVVCLLKSLPKRVRAKFGLSCLDQVSVIRGIDYLTGVLKSSICKKCSAKPTTAIDQSTSNDKETLTRVQT